MNSTYWPARNWKFWLAASCIVSTATSGAGLRMAATRVGSFSTGNSPAPGTVRASKVQLVCGRAQQVSTKPAASSLADKALGWWLPWMTAPSSSLLLHEPQAPSLQP